MAWYQEWFGEEYLELYSHRDSGEAEAHIRFVGRVLEDDGAPRAVLDLACGAGRHTAALRRRGYRALGLDLSLTLLARSPDLPRVAGDMGRLPFRSGTFDWVLNFFTSFGYFETEPENFQVLREVHRVLSPGGRFLMDFFNTGHVVANLEPRETQELDGRRVEIERWYDAESGRINKRIRVQSRDRRPRTYLESVRAYTESEIAAGLRWAGLQITDRYGSFDGEPLRRDSPRLIFACTKPA